MEKIIKVIALMNHHLVIAEIDEVAAADIGQPDCKVTKPFLINTESGHTVLEPYLNNVTRDESFMMGSDKILTLVDPTPQLLLKYEDLLSPPVLPATPIEE